MPKENINVTPGDLPTRVLIVEDDLLIGMAIETALTDAGIADVRLCTTSDQALTILREQTPDAVVLDVHLADRDDGWALAELVQSLGSNRPQVIFSTGSPEDIPEHIAQLGAVLTKPFAADTLIGLLREPTRRSFISRLCGVFRPD